MLEIYISSLAFLGESPENIVKMAKANDLNIEFSSGMDYREDMEDFYLGTDLKRILHNYFPAPKIPFVLNLASKDTEIRQKSIAHCINGLILSKKSGSTFFAAHAGFCIDPDPNELGKRIKYSATFDREEHRQLFLDSVRLILKKAQELAVDFLIENNVIASFNIIDGQNPLLCCESGEISWLFSEIEHQRLGLLLDTAHLKVSCQTLSLDLNEELNKIEPFIRAVHHSDNDGAADSNEKLDTGYWFLPSLKKYSHLPQVLEVKKINLEEISEQVKLLQQNEY
ncbi:MAG: TIM barrel protein [Pedobacter sp.]|nr:TIM barrel protein [Pedobacter sp.]MDQ8052881.1 TIM barrel protein [Pedobacter sp.]